MDTTFEMNRFLIQPDRDKRWHFVRPSIWCYVTDMLIYSQVNRIMGLCVCIFERMTFFLFYFIAINAPLFLRLSVKELWVPWKWFVSSDIVLFFLFDSFSPFNLSIYAMLAIVRIYNCKSYLLWIWMNTSLFIHRLFAHFVWPTCKNAHGKKWDIFLSLFYSIEADNGAAWQVWNYIAFRIHFSKTRKYIKSGGMFVSGLFWTQHTHSIDRNRDDATHPLHSIGIGALFALLVFADSIIQHCWCQTQF